MTARWVFGLALGSVLGSRVTLAQVPDDPLPVAGSLIYHGLLYNRANGSSSRGIGLRFAGRLSIRVGEHSYLGFGGGSWARVTVTGCDLRDCGRLVTSQSEAFIYHLYFQQYLQRKRLFVRGGSGWAQTRTLVPENSAIQVRQRWRGVLSVGGGVDIPLVRHVYLTPSLDFTALPGADGSAQELTSAFAVGLAITLH